MNSNQLVPHSLRQAAESAIKYGKAEMDLLKNANAKLKKDIQRLGCENFINLRVSRNQSPLYFFDIMD